MKQNKKVFFEDLGLIDYQPCWDYQKELFESIIALKLKNRDLPEADRQATDNYLIFCEHPNVYTLGRSGDSNNLLLDEKGLNEKHAEFYHINRGGDITFHGPGQIVGYPIFDLDNFFGDIHKFLRYMEDAVIMLLKEEYGIESVRGDKGYTGVWLDFDDPIKARKILAIGVHTSRWVTMHGFALNVNTNLDYFGHIVPCGIDNKGVTSLQKELGREMDIEDVKQKLKHYLSVVFEMELLEKQPVH